MKPLAPSPRVGAVFLYEVLLSGVNQPSWVQLYRFNHNGFVYDYYFPLARRDLTEPEARDVVRARKLIEQAQARFLNDVHLEGMQ